MNVDALKNFIISQGASRRVITMEWDKVCVCCEVVLCVVNYVCAMCYEYVLCVISMYVLCVMSVCYEYVL
jgi:hypothetical protein